MDISRSTRFQRFSLAAIAILSLALTGGARAAEDEYPQIDYVEQGEGWKELDTTLPPLPESDAFRALPSQIPNTSLEIRLDPDSIRVGEDGVIRYAMAIRSPSGASNLFYEGLRCETKAFKTYAYASSDRKWAEMDQAGWQDLTADGSARYRLFLYKNYFCGLAGERLSQREIRSRVRYGAPRFNEP